MATVLARPTRLPLRAASSLAATWRPISRNQAPTRQGPTMQASVRFKSGPYGYTQAKALVFSKLGEPADVLR